MCIVGFEFFTAMTMNNVVFCYMALCRSWVDQSFGRTYRLHPHGRKIRERGNSVSLQPPADCSALKLESIRYSGKSVNPGSTQRHIPEDDIFQDVYCRY
jgi:hypothetical protein